MNDATTCNRPSGEDGHGLYGHLSADVDVFFPADKPGVIYVRSAGTWLRYESSVPGTGTDATEFTSGNGRVPDPAPENLSLHWPGHQAGMSLELMRESKPRVYYDPCEHPGLFVTGNGGPPRAPLPVLEMNGHLDDLAPWLDPATGHRFTCDQARSSTAVLKYAPRPEQSNTPPEPLQGVLPAGNLVPAHNRPFLRQAVEAWPGGERQGGRHGHGHGADAAGEHQRHEGPLRVRRR